MDINGFIMEKATSIHALQPQIFSVQISSWAHCSSFLPTQLVLSTVLKWDGQLLVQLQDKEYEIQPLCPAL